MSDESHIRFVRALWESIREGGIVLTSEELLRFFPEFQGERELLEVVPYSYHARRLVRGSSYATRAEALEAIGAGDL